MPALFFCWWRGKDSNLRRQSRQIYSLFPLTAREPLQRNREFCLFSLEKSNNCRVGQDNRFRFHKPWSLEGKANLSEFQLRRRMSISLRFMSKMTHPILNSQALDTLFLHARSHNGWLDKPVEDALLQQAWALARMGPTSANCSPMRVVFIKSEAAKARLQPALIEGNRAKTLSAPVTAIFANDSRFHDLLPKLFPHADARSWFAGPDKEAIAATTAFRNGTLQAAYFMLAARALGLDCGPMSGFDNTLVDREFFPDGRIKSNFICNLGYGDPNRLFPRSPRLEFEEACRIV